MPIEQFVKLVPEQTRWLQRTICKVFKFTPTDPLYVLVAGKEPFIVTEDVYSKMKNCSECVAILENETDISYILRHIQDSHVRGGLVVQSNVPDPSSFFP